MRLEARGAQVTSSEESGCPLEHLRELVLEGNGVLSLLDRFRFDEDVDYEARLHFPVGARVVRLDPERCEVALGEEGARVVVRFESDSGVALRQEPYRFHPDYGASEEATCVVARAVPRAGRSCASRCGS